MKMNSMKKMLSILWCVVLIAAMALNITGCGSKPESDKPTETAADTQAATQAAAETEAAEGATVLGEGEVSFYFAAIDLEGIETLYEIHTDGKIVGEVLQELGLISGEEGDYGLYIKTVNGITLDWDTHGKYWSLLIDGEYAMEGIDCIEIVAGSTYTLTPAS